MSKQRPTCKLFIIIAKHCKQFKCPSTSIGINVSTYIQWDTLNNDKEQTTDTQQHDCLWKALRTWKKAIAREYSLKLPAAQTKKSYLYLTTIHSVYHFTIPVMIKQSCLRASSGKEEQKYLQATHYFINCTVMFSFCFVSFFYQEVQYLQLGLSICLIFL